MTTQEIIEELGFKSISEITEEKAKKRYRKLMKDNHPDLAFSEEEREQRENKAKRINEAYSNIERLIQRAKFEEVFKKKQEISAIIPLDGLISLYAGNSISLRDNTGVFELTKTNIRAHRITLECNCTILDKSTGLISSYTGFTPYIQGDEYELDCKLQVKDLSPLDIEIKAYDKVVNLKLDNIVTRLKLTYRFRVQLTINIQKVVVAPEEAD